MLVTKFCKQLTFTFNIYEMCHFDNKFSTYCFHLVAIKKKINTFWMNQYNCNRKSFTQILWISVKVGYDVRAKFWSLKIFGNLVVVSKVNWKKILVVVSKVNWMKILVVVSKVNLVIFSHFRNSRSGREPNLFPILGYDNVHRSFLK